MSHASRTESLPTPGAARLPVVVPVALISFFYAAVLEYSLPLYFSALGEWHAARGASFPTDIWSQLAKYQVTPWIVLPIAAGLLARRYGERLVWSGALIGQALVPCLLATYPSAQLIPLVALWQGVTGALMWIAGISLVQMVPLAKKGFANGCMMTAMGAGSVFGPLVGRGVLYRAELWSLAQEHAWSSMASRLFSFRVMQSRPGAHDFQMIFWCLIASTLFCGLLVGWRGQYPGRFEHESPPDWSRTLRDLGRLARISRFWALVIPLCLLGGPVFQASNQFLPYRAEQMGLKSGSQDAGWIWLQLLKTLMWLPGGAAVGCLAGRRAPGIAAVIMLAAFALCALGIGASAASWQLFACVAMFEFVRQFMRWSHAGYVSEHLPSDLRSSAIGAAITLSGLGSTLFGWIAGAAWDPTRQSSSPFWAAASLGGAASLGLLLFDRMHPIRTVDGEARLVVKR